MPRDFAAAAVRRSVEEAKRAFLAAFEEEEQRPRAKKERREAAPAPRPANGSLTVTDEDREWLARGA
ncbi:hypothetical protein [Anaeromyxobacter paludicola]|uniref:Uncharacterized protein n=1 Tax=Anaeromyxobacter paludicola TaxID=2918171 RepID=A0ABM7XCP2_9BACT|nr:hypothetical protein [Anaeromyxobacter paludicola]BDG09647.1 hypothetical protein AMPC_27600 [Anaeromyxobacter paludicola]